MKRRRLNPSLEALEDRTACSTMHPAHHAMAAAHHPAPHHPAAHHPAAHHPAPFRFAMFLPNVPPIYCSANPAFAWGYHLNDKLGTCVTAAQINLLYSQLQSVGYVMAVPDSSALLQYQRVGHYVPGNPATDQGESVIAAELDWVRNGYLDSSGHPHKAVAWGAVNFRNFTKLARAVYLFGGVTMTCALPSDAITQFEAGQTWSVTAGAGGAPWSAGSHEICVNGYNAVGPVGVTWGKEIQLTWGWMAAYCTEAYATVNHEEIAPNGHAANGLTLNQLVADLKAVI